MPSPLLTTRAPRLAETLPSLTRRWEGPIAEGVAPWVWLDESPIQTPERLWVSNAKHFRPPEGVGQTKIGHVISTIGLPEDARIPVSLQGRCRAGQPDDAPLLSPCLQYLYGVDGLEDIELPKITEKPYFPEDVLPEPDPEDTIERDQLVTTKLWAYDFRDNFGEQGGTGNSQRIEAYTHPERNIDFAAHYPKNLFVFLDIDNVERWTIYDYKKHSQTLWNRFVQTLIDHFANNGTPIFFTTDLDGATLYARYLATDGTAKLINSFDRFTINADIHTPETLETAASLTVLDRNDPFTERWINITHPGTPEDVPIQLPSEDDFENLFERVRLDLPEADIGLWHLPGLVQVFGNDLYWTADLTIPGGAVVAAGILIDTPTELTADVYCHHAVRIAAGQTYTYDPHR